MIELLVMVKLSKEPYSPGLPSSMVIATGAGVAESWVSSHAKGEV